MLVELKTVDKLQVAVLFRRTCAPARKPVPVTVNIVPPADVPDVGEKLLTVGAALYV
jgi:hypothetical protein